MEAFRKSHTALAAAKATLDSKNIYSRLCYGFGVTGSERIRHHHTESPCANTLFKKDYMLRTRDNFCKAGGYVAIRHKLLKQHYPRTNAVTGKLLFSLESFRRYFAVGYDKRARCLAVGIAFLNIKARKIKCSHNFGNL